MQSLGLSTRRKPRSALSQSRRIARATLIIVILFPRASFLSGRIADKCICGVTDQPLLLAAPYRLRRFPPARWHLSVWHGRAVPKASFYFEQAHRSLFRCVRWDAKLDSAAERTVFAQQTSINRHLVVAKGQKSIDSSCNLREFPAKREGESTYRILLHKQRLFRCQIALAANLRRFPDSKARGRARVRPSSSRGTRGSRGASAARRGRLAGSAHPRVALSFIFLEKFRGMQGVVA